MKIRIACFLVAFSAAAQTAAVRPAVFSGGGLNDAASGGRYTGATANAAYVVTISSTGAPDHFQWSRNAGGLSSPTPITGRAQAIADGVTITFAATTGHTLNDSWIILAALGSTASSLSLPGAAGLQPPGSQRDRPPEIVSVRDFGAVGDDSNDDTVAIQSCIDYSSVARASCFVPPGVYKLAGPGLHMYSGQPSLYGLQSMGNGSASLKYYGSGTCLSIGDGTHRIFAINLINIGCGAANGVSAEYGINAQNVSGGEWDGVTVGGGGVGGTFKDAIRFSDAGGINMRRLVISNRSYVPGTTGILFDRFVSFGNTDITIDVSDQANMDKMFEIRNLITGHFHDVYVENSAYGVYVDNTNYDAAIQNVTFDSSEFNTSGSGPSGYKIVSVTGVRDKVLEIDQLHFSDSRFYLSGGVAKPFVFNIDKDASPSSRIWLYLDNSVFIGANASVVDANSTLVNANFGPNLVRDYTGTVRTPDFSGVGTVQDIAPQDSRGRALLQRDSNGAVYLVGSSGDRMLRPALGARPSGSISGTSIVGPMAADDGFLRIQAGGTGTENSNAGCDFSGRSLIPDMDRNIVCSVNGAERLRMDVKGNNLSGPTTVSNGVLNIPAGGLLLGAGGTVIRKYATISARLDFPAPATVPGCTASIALTPTTRITASAPIFYSPPVTVPASMTFSAWTEPTGIIVARWCQFSGYPTDPDGQGAIYTVSVIE